MIDPRVQVVLLDIEGTTSSIAFVYDVMFPYVRKHVAAFLGTHFLKADVASAIQQMVRDAEADPSSDFVERMHASNSISTSALNESPLSPSLIDTVAGQVLALMDRDSKTTGLKALQGLVWEAGFQSGELRAHLFDDCFPALQRWKASGLTLAIYSSGSVVAQKLFFGHTDYGDLRPFFANHFDTTVGGKREPSSYQRIATELSVAPEKILFLSDIAAEIEAARTAGLQSFAVVRPGNAPLPESYVGPQITSFDSLSVPG